MHLAHNLCMNNQENHLFPLIPFGNCQYECNMCILCSFKRPMQIYSAEFRKRMCDCWGLMYYNFVALRFIQMLMFASCLLFFLSPKMHCVQICAFFSVFVRYKRDND
uniref:Uncharacterized protein n=1 Tax=Rhipicephalus zambeziensis TaxID=60191 RepID=A0A224YGW2_9ACAR